MLQRLIYIRFDARFGLILLRAVAAEHLLSLLKVRTNSLERDHYEIHLACAWRVVHVTSSEKSSSGAASMALMVSLLLGCTVAKPPDTGSHVEMRRGTTEKER
jgi:hypothetical protein